MYKNPVYKFPVKILPGLVACILATLPTGSVWGAYAAPVLYKQANVVLIQRKDVMWTGVPGEDYLNFGSVVVSGDNSKLMFNVTCEFCQAPAGFNNRPFVADTNGGNVTDISDLFPVDLASSWSGWGNMALDDDGSKAFISVLRSGGEKNIYYKDLSSGNNYHAVNSNDFSNAWLNHDASALYLGKFDAGYDDILQRHKQGLWWAQLGGAPRWYLDIHDMPCNGMCDNLNALGYMGNSKRDDHTFFVWNSGAPSNICAGEDCNHNALWHSQLDGRAETLTDREHYWVSSYVGGWRGISTERGETVLYSYIDRKGDPQKLVTVDRANRAEKELTWTTSLNAIREAFITPSGRYVLVRGTMGSAGGYHRQTLFDLLHDSTRDTWSYYLPNNTSYISNMALDRYYYLSFQKAPNAIYRIDTQADDNGDFSQAPNITSITFSDAVLWDDDTQMTVTVGVGDAQGWDNIQSVLLTVLVDGMEDTYWPMGREPLAFPTGDPGSTWLYDDGTHGDQTAGDGVFTFDAIATRKGDRGPSGFNTWYAHYSLPNDVGIRIIAQDRDGNSTIADTRLTIAACDDTGKTYSSDITGRVFACTSQNVRFLTGATVTAGTEMHLKSQTVSFQNDTRVEEGAVLSVSTE